MADVSLNGLKVKTDSLPNDWYVSLINPQSGEPAEIMTVARFTELFLNNNKIWTANNDGVNSGLDANLLNGKNENKFAQYGPYTTNNVDLMGGNISGFQTVNAVEGSNLPYNESGCLFFGGSLNGRAMQIFGSYIRNKWYVRGAGDSQSNKHTSWREIVFKDELPDLVANTANALTETISEDYSILPPPQIACQTIQNQQVRKSNLRCPLSRRQTTRMVQFQLKVNHRNSMSGRLTKSAALSWNYRQKTRDLNKSSISLTIARYNKCNLPRAGPPRLIK